MSRISKLMLTRLVTSTSGESYTRSDSNVQVGVEANSVLSEKLLE